MYTVRHRSAVLPQLLDPGSLALALRFGVRGASWAGFSLKVEDSEEREASPSCHRLYYRLAPRPRCGPHRRVLRPRRLPPARHPSRTLQLPVYALTKCLGYFGWPLHPRSSLSELGLAAESAAPYTSTPAVSYSRRGRKTAWRACPRHDRGKATTRGNKHKPSCSSARACPRPLPIRRAHRPQGAIPATSREVWTVELVSSS